MDTGDDVVPALCIVGCDRPGCENACFADAPELAGVLAANGWVRGDDPTNGWPVDLCPSCVAYLEKLAGQQ